MSASNQDAGEEVMADEREVAVEPVEPNAASAAERAVEAAQRIVVERLELIRLEVQEALAGAMVRSGLVLAAGFVAILGWTALAVALVLGLAEHVPLAGAIAVVGGAHVLAGVVMGAIAASSGSRRPT